MSTTENLGVAEIFDNDSASLSRIDKQINYVIDLVHQESTSRDASHQSGVYKKLIQDLNKTFYMVLDEIHLTQSSLVVPETFRKDEPF